MVTASIGLETYMELRIALIEKRLDQLIPLPETSYRQLYEAARYSLLGGGKRLRPLIALATAEALGATIEDALDPACALEMVHAYSLIHDDLPCMDDDDYRRGRLTLHRVFPEGHAVLAGDFLLTEAFGVIAAAASLTDSQKTALVFTLSQAAGGSGMVAGQVMDLEAEDSPISLHALQQIHEYKTAALLTAAFEFGGIIARAPSQVLESLRLVGRQIGLAFQVVDDILDVVASETKHGKTSSDENNGKTTYVSLLGLEESKEFAGRLLRDTLEQLETLPGDPTFVKELCRRLVERIR